MPQLRVVGPNGGKIGIAVRERSGFKFFTAHDDFRLLDGRTFHRARSLVNEVAKHARKVQRTTPSASPDDGGLW